MKIGITSTLFGVCDNDVVKEVPRFSRLGFDYIEVVSRNPRSVDTEQLLGVLGKSDIKVCAICGWCNYLFQNPAHENRYVRRAYVDYVKDLVDLSSSVEAGLVVVSAGIFDKVGREKAYEFSAECLREIGTYASGFSIKIAVEAVSRFVTNFINRADQALKLVECVDNPSVGITLDTFHMNIEERSLADAIKQAEKSLFHMHLADNNRLAPGLGHIDFEEIIGQLEAIGYDGNLSLEIQGSDDPEKEAQFGLNFMKNIVKKERI